jgi:Uma2 family endonuclease
MTAEDVLDLPERPGMVCELVAGELREVPGAGALHGLIAAKVLDRIHGFVQQRDLGLVLPDGVGYVLSRDPDQLRIPDVSFVVWDKVPDDGIPDGFWEGSPTLAVEIISPQDWAVDIHAKVRGYLEAGTRQVWVLWPQQTSVTIYDPAGQRELGPDEELSGGDVLPGFRACVGDLFEVRRRR